MTNNTAQAEDLTQDAFLQVFRKLSTFKGNSALSTWLYRIAVNTVLMHFRKKALKQVSLDEPSSHDAKQVRREYGSRDGRLSGSVDRITLTRAIKDLPAGYRKIFLLHEVEGYEHQEIAKMLDCSVGNSKSQLHKAKLRIREFLAEPGSQADRGSETQECRRRERPSASRSAIAASLTRSVSAKTVSCYGLARYQQERCSIAALGDERLSAGPISAWCEAHQRMFPECAAA